MPTRAFAMLVVVAVLTAGCASRPPAPVVERVPRQGAPAPPPMAAPAPAPAGMPGPRAADPDPRPPSYVVQRGDTLYKIALDNGLDYRDLAAWNNIENPNLIRVGQVLRLRVPGAPAPTVGAEPDGVVTSALRSAPSSIDATPMSPAPGVTSASPAPVAAGVPAGAAAGTPPVAAAATPPVASPGSPSRTDSESYKTTPKALRLPYSESALAQAQQAARSTPPSAAAASTPPGTALATSVPGPATRVAPPPAASTQAGSAAGSAALPPPGSPPPPRAVPANPDAGSGDDEAVEWIWPAQGKVIAGFSESANLKGIDIAGRVGAPVVASAEGKVVYAGSGLRGYGKLIIIKHNKTFLSAYAHNRQILVREGQQVTRGQKIGEMGDTDTDTVKLHFEIRRFGKPIDPARLLPAG